MIYIRLVTVFKRMAVGSARIVVHVFDINANILYNKPLIKVCEKMTKINKMAL